MDSRENMLADIVEAFRRTAAWTGLDAPAASVAAAMRVVPRAAFVPRELAMLAHSNQALPIGCGQTISQPFIVALMTTLLRVGRDSAVLEIGTGSGYQAAVLAQLVSRVDTVEVVPELAAAASARLEELGYRNATVHLGDGSVGFAEHAPYDGILVTACAPEVPPALLAQLRTGGRIVLPIGPEDAAQRLVVVDKSTRGVCRQRAVLDVRFVPLRAGS
ncbi:MAG: protein-L-isoaspartate(D-aspartate) O-methyltransferase [Planctomycetes bacterium]|nr:protein-L-isoaspartate(D-aspartate) O-methyltransferase [Planctomycetota bacterium]